MLWIRLQGQPIDGGGVAMTASGASYGPTALPDAYVGKIVEPRRHAHPPLAERTVANRLSLLVDLQLDPATGAATGTVHGTPTSLQ